MSKVFRYMVGGLLLMLCLTACKRTRTEKVYHDNGNLMYEITYKGSLKHGPSVYYFSDGRKEAEFNYANDLLDGKVTRWYFNGNTEYVEEYRDNKLHGVSRNYFLSGQISEERHYKDGELNGSYKVFWENGAVKIKGAYLDGLYHGQWEYFNEAGQKVGVASFEKGNGTMTGYYRHGRKNREVNYANNLKHGSETVWSEDGELVTEYIYQWGELIQTINHTSPVGN